MVSILKRSVEWFGLSCFAIIDEFGSIFIFLGKTFKILICSPPKRVHVLAQMYKIGFRSLPVVLITGAFTGMVLAIQSYYQFQKVSMETAVGILVGLSMTNELGPVLTGLMVAGRVGASMSAELGTMKVTEQVDALEALAVNPIQYLIVPRFIACITLIPLLTVFAVFIGIVGAYLIGVKLLGINAAFFLDNLLRYTTVADLMHGLIKSVYFALIIVLISCYRGMNTTGGAEGVGKVATSSVVVSCITILIADFFLSILFI